MWSIPSRPGTVVTLESVPVLLRRPEWLDARHLVRHPVRIADQLDVRPERRLEVVDRLAGGRTGGQRERPEELLDALRLHVRDGGVDVGDVERDVVTRPVGVARMRLALVGRLVLEQLDVRAVADAEHGDLVDRPRADRRRAGRASTCPRRIGDRAERQRRRRAHHVLEPSDGLADVGHGQADVVGADEPELALTAACAPSASGSEVEAPPGRPRRRRPSSGSLFDRCGMHRSRLPLSAVPESVMVARQPWLVEQPLRLPRARRSCCVVFALRDPKHTRGPRVGQTSGMASSGLCAYHARAPVPP